MKKKAVARRPLAHSPTLWLNLACLDAPLVALAWQWLFARAFQVHLNPAPRILLFLTVWAIYLADRFADTLALKGEHDVARRHRFCQRHRVLWVVAIIVIAISATWLAFSLLDRTTLALGGIVAALCALYLATNLWLCGSWRILPVKEIAIGLLFATGTVLALVPRLDVNARFAVSAGLFATLCCLNCISIAAWERDLDILHGKTTLLTRWPALHRALPGLAVAFALTCFVSGIFGCTLRSISVCAGTSALLLATLDLFKNAIPRDHRTALADLVLLTPLVAFLACLAQ